MNGRSGALERVPKVSKFLFHQQPRRGLADEMRDPFDRRMRSMRCAKRIVDIDIGHCGERFTKLRIVLLLLGVEPQIFEQHHRS
jgi:hypothetical protein